MSLPLPTPSATRPQRRVRSAAAGPRVLLVDDNRDAAELLHELLTLRGYRASVAFDAPSALALLREERFDLGVFDIGMPVIDGYELVRRVRDRVGDAMGIVALTGYGQPEDRRRALKAGFDHHLVKPVRPSLLIETLRKLGGEKAAATAST